MRERILLIVLGAAAAGALTYAMWPPAGPARHLSQRRRESRKPETAIGARSSVAMRLGDLKQPVTVDEHAARNPFAFYATPPPPPRLVTSRTPATRTLSDPTEGPAPPAAPPPIPIKFIGVVEQGTTKVAIFSDGKGQPVWASEGQTVLGQFKLLTIGVESVTMTYLDGKGLQAIPMRG